MQYEKLEGAPCGAEEPDVGEGEPPSDGDVPKEEEVGEA